MRLTAILLLLVALLACTAVHAGSITDLSQWTLVEDPPNSHLSGSAESDDITLLARGGEIPSGTDIGFQSVDADSVASSGSGFYFSPDESFRIAVDFNLSFAGSPDGALGIGFGIGEDSDGTDSAGVAMLTNNGNAFGTFSAAGRVDDSNLMPLPIGVGAALQGSMFVGYNALTGDVILGASQSPGASSPIATATYAGIQNDWDDDGLLVSLFLRSQTVPLPLLPDLLPWQRGDADAIFSNLRVLSGTPREVGAATGVPLPSSLALLLPGLLLRRRPCRG